MCNQWIYWEKTITGVTSISIEGSGLIDEVRLYPKAAQMKTFTYDPIIGVTGSCDETSRITYFEYDGLGRLKYIKDQDKFILKSFDYKYQEQQ
jgi:YD repeat-containing protein